MNKQRKLVRRICVAGVSGVLAAGVIVPSQMMPFTESIAAEAEQVVTDPSAIENPENIGAPVAEENPVVPEVPVVQETPEVVEDLVNPEVPADPESPEEPTDPSNPEVPANPEEPTDPSNPEVPVDPSDPSNPEVPADPSDPNNPEVPADPSDPNNPEVPVDPTNPEVPVDPADPSNPEVPTDPTNPEVPIDPADPVNPADPTDPANPEEPTDPSNPEEPIDPEIPDVPEEPAIPEEPKEPELEVNITDMIVDIDQLKPEEITPARISNAQLIMNKKLVKLPKIVEDFRFWTVARKYAFAREDLIIREAYPVEEEEAAKAMSAAFSTEELKEENIRTVGSLEKNGLLYILKEEENGWFYVESGRVRGFVKAEEVITGEEAVPQLEAYQNEAKTKAEEEQTEYTGIEGIVPMAVELVPWQQNEAFTYLRATVGQTVADKKYAIAEEEPVEIKEDRNDAARVIGVVPKGGLCYILEDGDQEWIYVESGDVRGFVRNESVQYGEEIEEKVEEKTEEKFKLAEEKIKPEENGACYYTLTSTKPGVPDGEIRRSMVEFAAQFVGNPYVWGGTSLTDGADCSGFVQSIYKQYGYDIPRVSRDQAQYGTAIPVEDALPGDLIFYADNGYIHHVVMYAGGGKTIEAMSTDAGIVQADVNKNSAVWATRILKDNDYGYAGGGISDVNATPSMYGRNLGTFKLTYYCACELCCNVETGITATGAPVVEGRTIAVDPRVIPYGTQVIIGGHIFTAEDCGGAIKENRIDIYVNSHEEALALGVNYADVYLKK